MKQDLATAIKKQWAIEKGKTQSNDDSLKLMDMTVSQQGEILQLKLQKDQTRGSLVFCLGRKAQMSSVRLGVIVTT